MQGVTVIKPETPPREEDIERLREGVAEILKGIKEGGDKALREFSRRFDNYDPPSFRVGEEEMDEAERSLDPEVKRGLDYGIELGGGAVATLNDNTITNNTGVADSDGSTSAGILITTYYGAGTAGTVSGNFVSGNTGGVAVGYDEFDVSVVTAGDNDLSGNVSYAVDNTSNSLTVDASANWYGSNDAAAVAAMLGGSVDYTPWLDVGTDTDGGTPGFQGDFSALWVDDDSPQTGAAGRVQEGVDLVTASTVNILAGTLKIIARNYP